MTEIERRILENQRQIMRVLRDQFGEKEIELSHAILVSAELIKKDQESRCFT